MVYNMQMGRERKVLTGKKRKRKTKRKTKTKRMKYMPYP
jgi:hypothetical protein